MDRDLTSLERHAPDDRAATAKLLRARVRAGQLTEQRLKLASYLGSPLPALLLGDAAPRPEPRSYPCHGVALGLKPYGPQAYLRAALGCMLLVPYRRRITDGEDAAAVRDWLRCPCDEHEALLRSTRYFRLGSGAVSCTLRLALTAKDYVEAVHGKRAHRQVRNAMGRAVIPWALGRGDPILEGIVERLLVRTKLDEQIARGIPAPGVKRVYLCRKPRT